MGTSKQLIVALDFSDIRHAEALVQELGDRIETYKVGLQLLTGAGPRIGIGGVVCGGGRCG